MQTWGPTGIPVLMASAINGPGVIETFKCLLELTYDLIDSRYSLGASQLLTRDAFVDNLTRLPIKQL